MGAIRIGCWDAADLTRGSGSTRRRDIATRRRGLGIAPQLWLVALVCGGLIAIQQLRPFAFEAPTLRAIVETDITLCALAAAFLFALSYGHRRRLRDLFLVAALLQVALIDLVSYVVPAAIDIHSPGLTAAPTLGTLIGAATLLACATVPTERQLPPGRRPLALALGSAVLGAAVAEFGGLLLRGVVQSGGTPPAHGIAVALQHPVGVALTLVTGGLLIAAAVRFGRAAGMGGTGIAMLLAAAMALFAAARLNYLVLPTPGIGFVTAREGLRVCAYALILAAALRQEAAIRRSIAELAAREERQRIARDLHDGLAQDLAFIAAHGARIAGEAGEDHPLAIAARRALAVSRGAIADLSAADAPTARAAFRQVAGELEVRFGVRVHIDADEIRLDPSAREHVVRIVREAIVNAAKAHAHNVTVILERRADQFVLRVVDDGPGIEAGALKSRAGFGLRSMCERANALGGGVTARRSLAGGTELEVLFP